MKRISARYLFALWVLIAVQWFVGCDGGQAVQPPQPEGYVERVAQEVSFNNIEVYYMGAYLGDQTSDGWLIKLSTDMDTDSAGNPIGPGSMVQLLLNTPYNDDQEANVDFLGGIYTSQTNSGDFSVGSFVSGYINIVELPGERLEQADATYWAELGEGATAMDCDLVDDGAVEIRRVGDHFEIEGVLVGQKCRKHRFVWSGKVEPKDYVKSEVSNSTLRADMTLDRLSRMYIQDRGDIYYLGDESYRCFTLFLASEGVDFSSGKPRESGEFLRLDMLVAWQSVASDGIPAGTYRMTNRNADTSIDRLNLIPFTLIPGLPNRFTYPYWSGSWYVELTNGRWGQNYARIDEGSVVVERDIDGAHRFVCRLVDCSEAGYAIEADVRIEEFELLR